MSSAAGGYQASRTSGGSSAASTAAGAASTAARANAMSSSAIFNLPTSSANTSGSLRNDQTSTTIRANTITPAPSGGLFGAPTTSQTSTAPQANTTSSTATSNTSTPSTSIFGSLQTNQTFTAAQANTTNSNGQSNTPTLGARLICPVRTSQTTTSITSASVPGSNLFSFKPSTGIFPAPFPGVRKPFVSAPKYGNAWFTVLVGPEEEGTSFSLHEELAREESGFIEAAFRNGWKESEERVIRLPDYDPEHFQLFFLWIYNRTIFSAKEGDVPVGEIDKEWERLACTWALGAYLQAPDFRDAVTDAIIEKLTSCFGFEQNMHEIIYPSTDASAPIRKLIVDIAIWRWGREVLSNRKNDASWSDFFYDLSIALMASRKTFDPSGTPPWVKDPCSYHEHLNQTSTCYKS